MKVKITVVGDKELKLRIDNKNKEMVNDIKKANRRILNKMKSTAISLAPDRKYEPKTATNPKKMNTKTSPYPLYP